MKLLRKRDVPEEKYANAFLGYGPEESHFVVELTYSMFWLFFFSYVWYFMVFSHHDIRIYMVGVQFFDKYMIVLQLQKKKEFAFMGEDRYSLKLLIILYSLHQIE